MAQLVASSPGSERISQILPTVKCSSCNAPVPISELGDHVCPLVPPVPQLPALKPPQSPRTVAALLPTKLQSLVNAHSPPRSSRALPQGPSRQNSPAPRRKSPAPSSHNQSYSQLTGRPRAPSSASSLSVRSGDSRPERVPSPLASSDGRPSIDKVPFPSSPRPPLPPDPFAANPMPQRTRAPSNASTRTNMNSDSPAPSNPPRVPIQLRAGPPSDPRQRAGTNSSIRPTPPQPSQTPDIIYSTDIRTRPPSAASTRPSIDQPRPSISADSMRPSIDSIRRPSAESQRPPFIGIGLPASPAQVPLSMQPPRAAATPAPNEPDTKTGGEAGMAGVGRRGFAAAARAAMFTTHMGPAPVVDAHGGIVAPNQGMDGRRANAPRYLDIASASRYAATTPPLSPGSGTASLSPHSPYSQQSPTIPGGGEPSPNGTPTTPATGIAASPTSPISVSSLRDRMVAPPDVPTKPADGLPATPRLPFFEKFKNSLPALDTGASASAVAEPAPPSSPTGSDDSYGGLAYANSDDGEDEPVILPLRASPQPIAPFQDSKTKTQSQSQKVRFPSMTESRYSAASSSSSSRSSATRGPAPRTLSSSTAASSSAYTLAHGPRVLSKSTGALDRAMETLFEEGLVSPTSSAGSSSVTRGASARDSASVGKAGKVPTRSHTSPTLPSNRPVLAPAAAVGTVGLGEGKAAGRSASTVGTAGAGAGGARRAKRCVRCERAIEDGRWIQMEGGNVLCDRCWKNMYLPKCRRCNKVIEKQAVSSSDGQLKGKWHRECFSCSTCQKPFPDRSFYVYDGKPYCAYHYHEENNSLCAAARCGQPVEGPCAVSHAGDRYHPAHFLCEHPRGCTERLVEYYELDGRMLCERHVRAALRERGEGSEDGSAGGGVGGGAWADADGEGRGSRSTRAMKRVTRFVDLDALGKTLS